MQSIPLYVCFVGQRNHHDTFKSEKERESWHQSLWNPFETAFSRVYFHLPRFLLCTCIVLAFLRVPMVIRERGTRYQTKLNFWVTPIKTRVHFHFWNFHHIFSVFRFRGHENTVSSLRFIRTSEEEQRHVWYILYPLEHCGRVYHFVEPLVQPFWWNCSSFGTIHMYISRIY